MPEAEADSAAVMAEAADSEAAVAVMEEPAATVASVAVVAATVADWVPAVAGRVVVDEAAAMVAVAGSAEAETETAAATAVEVTAVAGSAAEVRVVVMVAAGSVVEDWAGLAAEAATAAGAVDSAAAGWESPSAPYSYTLWQMSTQSQPSTCSNPLANGGQTRYIRRSSRSLSLSAKEFLYTHYLQKCLFLNTDTRCMLLHRCGLMKHVLQKKARKNLFSTISS